METARSLAVNPSEDRLDRAVSRRQLLRKLGWVGAVTALSPAVGARAQTGAPVLPAPAATPPPVYRFGIGDFEATVISDGFWLAPAPLQPTWAPQATTEEFTRALRENFLPTDRLELAINLLVVRTGKEVVLVDTGAGRFFGPAAGRLLPGLAAAGIRAEEITAVILTHAHPDHFGGLLNAAGQPVFAQAQHFVSAQEFAFWTAPNPSAPVCRADPETIKQAVAGARTYLLALGDRFKRVDPARPGGLPDGFVGVPTPGHTPGHLSLRIRSGREELLHLADTVHHFALMIPHPGWTVAFDLDEGLAAESRRKLLAQAAGEQTRVFGYHLPFPGIGHLSNSAGSPGGLRWVAEPWSQLPIRRG